MLRIENVVKLAFAVIATFPLFYKSHWLIGAVSIIGMFIVFHAGFFGVIRMTTYSREDGNRYVASSARGLPETLGLLMGGVVAFLCFMLLSRLVGWGPN